MIFNQVKNHEVEAIIEPEVFAEVIFVLSSFYEFARQKIAKDLTALLAYRGFIMNRELYVEALKLHDINTKLSIVDCLLAIRARNKKMQLLSFDKALLKQINQ